MKSISLFTCTVTNSAHLHKGIFPKKSETCEREIRHTIKVLTRARVGP